METNLYVQETQVNVTEGYTFGDSEVYETFTDSVQRLFRACQREHGRCTGRVYIDGADGKARAIGWVFVKRERYQDSGEYFTLETWVTLHQAPPDRHVTYHYHETAS